ncbi:MAG: enoyl-CoA hydratase/isomerase family protein [Alphaproteobacteria bacterium]|nr:enoyl-CoA hydratase/isomerase family protein [Alphaproteobacteria bacterium]
MPTDKLLYQRTGAIARIVFNNPARHNAVSLEMWEAANDALDQAAADPDVRVLVVAGAGGKAFVSGADISKFESERASAEAVERYNRTGEQVYSKLHGFPRPTIAAIQGYCVGGGVGIATSCDIRLCSEGSRFAIPAARLGLGYAFAGIRRLVDVVGPAFAKEMFFTARQYSASEAAAMGLVNRIVPDGEFAAYLEDYVQTIAGNAPLTVAQVKRTVGEVVKDPAERDIAACERMIAACFASEDYREGRTAFMEKRRPVFKGR